MFRFRWLGRILLCFLVGLVLSALILGFGPPLPKAPNHLGLDAFHRYHYDQVWKRGEMPQNVDMYAYEPGDDMILEDSTAHSYKSQLKKWKWNAQTKWRSAKLQILKWWKENKEKRSAKK
jgi:hypothetical protein